MKLSRNISSIVLSFMLLIVLVMQLVLRPLFVAFNWVCLDEANRSLGHLLDISRYGLAQDCAVAGYLAVPLFLLLLLPERFKKVSKIAFLTYLTLISLLISLITTGDALLYEAWQNRMDASVFDYLANPAGVAESASNGQIVGFILMFLILAALLETLFVVFYKKMIAKERNRKREWIMYLPLVALMFVAIRGLARTPNSPVNAYYSKDKFSNHAAVNEVFNMFNSMLKHAKKENVAYYEEKQCNEIYRELTQPLSDNNILKLRTDRPNVLFIIMEGFGAHLIEGLGGKPDIAPRLTELCDSSICFTQAYCSSWRTMQGIVSVLSGYPAQPTTYILHDMSKAKSLGGVAKDLSNEGYDTHVLYGGDITYFNFLDYFYASGHKSYTSLKDFPDVDQGSRSGVPDDRTFDWLFQHITHNKSDKKWMTTFLTLSSHEPFNVPYQRLKDKRENAFAYTDSCVGDFVDKLRQTPQWEDLLIVLTSDHSFIYTPDIDVTSPVYAHIPLMLLGGAIEQPRRIDKIVSQTDIPATVLSLMNLKHESYSFSRNVLSKDYTYPYAWNCFNDGFAFRDSTGCTIYDMNQDKVTYGEDKTRLERAKAYVQKVYEDMNKR